MIDALRKDAWPRGVRRQRRELEAAREALRRELGHEPSMADLAARVGSDEKRLSRTIVRINTIESTSPLATGEHVDESCAAGGARAVRARAPDAAYEKLETRERVRAAIAVAAAGASSKVIGLYYYGEVTMKQIGAEIGVNESRVSQLHARAIRRLRDALGEMSPQQVAEMRQALVAFAREADDGEGGAAAAGEAGAPRTASCSPYKPAREAPDGQRARRRVKVAPRRGGAAGRRRAASLGRVSGQHFAHGLAANRRAGTAWRASGSRSPRETARRRCRRHRRSRRSRARQRRASPPPASR